MNHEATILRQAADKLYKLSHFDGSDHAVVNQIVRSILFRMANAIENGPAFTLDIGLAKEFDSWIETYHSSKTPA